MLERVGLLFEHGGGAAVGQVVLLLHLEHIQVKRLVGLGPLAIEEVATQQAVGLVGTRYGSAACHSARSSPFAARVARAATRSRSQRGAGS